MSGRHEEIFSKEDIQMANRAEKMLSITYQGNTNHNYKEKSSPLVRMAKINNTRNKCW